LYRRVNRFDIAVQKQAVRSMEWNASPETDLVSHSRMQKYQSTIKEDLGRTSQSRRGRLLTVNGDTDSYLLFQKKIKLDFQAYLKINSILNN
jgi:hypothetical protein